MSDGFISWYSFLIIYVLIGVEGADKYLYKIGAGIADITGPAAEINMFGYAKLGQDTSGIHLRLFTRTVIVVDSSGNRICYMSADLGGFPEIVKIEVLKRLKQKYGELYRYENVMFSATHTHSGPGGYTQYFLLLFTSLGFISDSFYAIVDGTVKSIERAHQNLKPGYIYFNKGQLLNANINRSPASYANNPKEERDEYKYNTDKSMTLLKFVDTNGKPIAMINWYAVHGVSMNNTNQLISSDNKGYASLLFEKDYNSRQLPGKGRFVALFAQTNEGDVSPNTAGPLCKDTGEACDFVTSTCPKKDDICLAFGPGMDMFESTQIIARKQYKKAKKLFKNAKNRIGGDIQFIYQNINMSDFEVKLSTNKTIRTCTAALGYAFAAGTTDGRALTIFHQGSRREEESKFLNFVRDLLFTKPSEEMIDCQSPKAIILPVGQMKFPYEWVPDVVPTQLLKIGDLVIAGLPGEFTTMSGRRLLKAIRKTFANNGQKVKVILSGLSNIYTNYVATYEEYQIQRYEGGATLFGPHTLQAYVQQFIKLAENMATKTGIPGGPSFSNLLKKEITLKPGVVLDTPKSGYKFGDVLFDAQPTYGKGTVVKVTLVGAHPRNNLRLESTFLTVDRQIKNSTEWKIIATDANWETKFIWRRTNVLLGQSEVDIVWDIPRDILDGKYRIRYFGDHKNIFGRITPFVGASSVFRVIDN